MAELENQEVNADQYSNPEQHKQEETSKGQ